MRWILMSVIILGLALPTGASDLRTYRGTISIGGSEPFTMLVLKGDDGGLYEVRGPSEKEMRSIGPGWVVEAVGRAGQATGPLPTPLTVYQYRIVEVRTPSGPRKPFIGRVVQDDGWLLVGEDLRVYRLEGGLPCTLSGLEDGMRVGIVGNASAWGKTKRLKVEFYAILR